MIHVLASLSSHPLIFLYLLLAKQGPEGKMQFMEVFSQDPQQDGKGWRRSLEGRANGRFPHGTNVGVAEI